MTNAEWIESKGYKFSNIKIQRDKKDKSWKIFFHGKYLKVPNYRKFKIANPTQLDCVMIALDFVMQWLDDEHDDSYWNENSDK